MKSPNYDNGYDISDYQDIDPRYGTLADFDEMVEKLHSLGMKFVLDLVVNHSRSTGIHIGRDSLAYQRLTCIPGSSNQDRAKIILSEIGIFGRSRLETSKGNLYPSTIGKRPSLDHVGHMTRRRKSLTYIAVS